MSERESDEALQGMDEHLVTVLAEIVDASADEAFADGWYEVEYDDGRSVGFELSLEDSRVLARVDRFLRDVLRRNREVVDIIADPDDPGGLLAVGRRAIDAVRLEAYQCGEYEVGFDVDGEEDLLVSFTLGERQAALLRRYHLLLRRVYLDGRNRFLIDDLVEAKAHSTM